MHTAGQTIASPVEEQATWERRIVAAPPVARAFYERPPEMVAPALLGAVLVRQERDCLLAGRIVETEAYLGAADPAAHAHAGLTERTRVLFGPAGHAYVYKIYGMHSCLNVSCQREGEPGCVLIRALEPLAGLDMMAHLRGQEWDTASPPPRTRLRLLASGPARLAQALGITRPRDNGKDVTAPESDLRIVRPPGESPHPAQDIRITPRIGITKAADLPLRYLLRNNCCVSGKERT